MGAGKSTAARRTAELLGIHCSDSDELIEEKTGLSAAQHFEAHGEPAFRAAEEAAVLELLAQPPQVISLGGGSLGSVAVVEALEDHVTVLLDVDLDVAWARIQGSDRPLGRDRAGFEYLYHEREAVYRELADANFSSSDSDVIEAALPSLVSMAHGSAGSLRMLWAAGPGGGYPVWVGEDALAHAPWPLPVESRRIVVSDTNVGDLYAGKIPHASGLIEIPAGEESKTLQTAESVWHALVEQHATRADHIVAVGGGVVGDLAGFCAGTYQRGVPVVQVPTTLVAQVDSAFGGKTGVDLPEAKNYVGIYHQPSAVIVDPALLASLPPEQMAAGYAEVVKTALIAGGLLWERVGGGDGIDEQIIRECARTKLAVVAADERDAGPRQKLNLGHTVGHAIEAATGYSVLNHGEAISLGLLAALRLSDNDELRAEVKALLAAAGLPTSFAGLDVEAVLEATTLDKKRLRGDVPFVLCSDPGSVRYGVEVDERELRAAVEELVA
ncbi:MAG: iron-containing alcohol dehydrogenase [Actinobacteria bacterium]|nr:iron-containing alcohol dehydrogenase [Actinomycetota bacterium]